MSIGIIARIAISIQTKGLLTLIGRFNESASKRLAIKKVSGNDKPKRMKASKWAQCLYQIVKQIPSRAKGGRMKRVTVVPQ